MQFIDFIQDRYFICFRSLKFWEHIPISRNIHTDNFQKLTHIILVISNIFVATDFFYCSLDFRKLFDKGHMEHSGMFFLKKLQYINQPSFDFGTLKRGTTMYKVFVIISKIFLGKFNFDRKVKEKWDCFYYALLFVY